MNSRVLVLIIAAAYGWAGVSSALSLEAGNDTAEKTIVADSKVHFTTNSTVDDYLSYAFEHNPALRKAQAEAKAANAMSDGSGYLSDPELSLEYMVEQHDMQYSIKLTQMIPGFGKLRLQKEAAGKEAEASIHDVQAVRLMVYEMVIKVFYEYMYLARSLEITKDNIALLEDLTNVITAMYKSQSTPYSAVLKVQVEKDKLNDRFASLTDMRKIMSSRLGFLLGLPSDDLLPLPKATEPASGTLPDDVLETLLAELNPELKAIDSRITALEIAAKLARKRYAPDFFLGAGYNVMPEMEDGSTPTDLGLMVGISLPIWFGKNRAAAAEADYRKEAAGELKNSMRNELMLELKEALFHLKDADRQIELLTKSLIPKARESYEVAKRDFSSGASSFMTLIDAQRTLLDLDLRLARSRSDREIAMGTIGCCIGKFDFHKKTTDNGKGK